MVKTVQGSVGAAFNEAYLTTVMPAINTVAARVLENANEVFFKGTKECEFLYLIFYKFFLKKC